MTTAAAVLLFVLGFGSGFYISQMMLAYNAERARRIHDRRAALRRADRWHLDRDALREGDSAPPRQTPPIDVQSMAEDVARRAEEEEW